MSARTFGLAAILAACPLAAPSPAAASAEEKPDPAAPLRALLAEYDRAGGGNTIPIEQGFLELRDRGEAGALASLLPHERFGGTALWALVETGKPGFEEAVLARFESMNVFDRAEAASSVGALRTPRARNALKAAARKAEGEGAEALRTAVRPALVRAGDEAALAALREDLASKEPDRMAAALLLAGDGREASFLADAARLAADARPLVKPVPSAFAVQVVKKLPDGGEESNTTYPERKTLGAAALEAANRMVRHTTPEFIAWWYEMEKGPRFGFDAAAPARLQAWVRADEAAAKAKAVRASGAVAALVRRLRKEGRGEGTLVLGQVSFAGSWTIPYELDGVKATAAVDPAGAVSGALPAAPAPGPR